jgi:hypothetical protein
MLARSAWLQNEIQYAPGALKNPAILVRTRQLAFVPIEFQHYPRRANSGSGIWRIPLLVACTRRLAPRTEGNRQGLALSKAALGFFVGF